MTVVQNVTNSPGGPHANRTVFITLIAGTNGAPGYTSSGTIVGIWTTQTDNTGHWSHDFTPNDQITPANTVYQVTEEGGVSIISVPDSGGPYNLSQVLVASPPTPAAPGITGLQVADNGTVAGVRPKLNLIPGTGIAVTAVDNPATNAVDVTLTATGNGELLAANNLSDLASASSARTNLGLGSAATQNTSAFDAAGAASAALTAAEANAASLYLQKSSNLSDLASAATARANLGVSPALPLKSTWFYPQDGGGGSETLVFGQLELWPFDFQSAQQITKLALNVKAAGVAGALIRFAIYASDGAGFVGNLLLDPGTISGSATGVGTISSLTQNVGPGRVWFGAVYQGANGTQPQVQGYAKAQPYMGWSSYQQFPSIVAYQWTGITGALPTTLGNPAGFQNNQAPAVQFAVA